MEDETNLEIFKMKRRLRGAPFRPTSGTTEISNSLAVTCALSIPQDKCPSTHKEFLKKHEEENANKMVKSDLSDEMKTMPQLTVGNYPIKMNQKNIPRRKRRLRRQQPAVNKKDVTKTGDGNSGRDSVDQPLVHIKSIDDGTTCCNKSLSEHTLSIPSNETDCKLENANIKEIVAKPRQFKSKRWIDDDNDEAPVVQKIGPEELLINGQLVVVNYTDYIKESDVVLVLPYDDSDDSHLRPLPGYARRCQKDFCRLGCICKSIAGKEIVRSKCQNEKCNFGCICFPSSDVDNKGDIRSRLRPRVTLLNWKHSGNAEKDFMGNYKQLERGIFSPSPRAKRSTQSSPRLRNGCALESVRSPRQCLPDRKIRKQMRCTLQYGMISNKRNGSPGLQSPIHSIDKKNKAGGKRSVFRRPNLKRNHSIVDVSRLDNSENYSDFDSVSPGNFNFQPEKSQKCAEESPSILFQKLGNVPDEIDEELFLRSNAKAVKSYWSLKHMLKDVPPEQQFKRHDGRIVVVSWTANSKCPKVISQLSNPEKSIKGDHIMVPLLPENSEWLMYEFPTNYEKSSSVSFSDIGLVMFTKTLIFQKIKADINNKVVKLKLKHPERLNSKSSINLYLLPRVGNLAVLGPVKKDFNKTVKATFPQTLSYIRSLHQKNVFGSPRSWDFSLLNNQDKLVEPFHLYIQRKQREDTEALTGRIVPPETMDQIIPEFMETYEPDEIPSSFRLPSSPGKKHVMQLKWSDSIKCSAHFNP